MAAPPSAHPRAQAGPSGLGGWQGQPGDPRYAGGGMMNMGVVGSSSYSSHSHSQVRAGTSSVGASAERGLCHMRLEVGWRGRICSGRRGGGT